MNEHKVSDMALAVGSVSASVARGPVASAIPLTGRSSMVSLDRMIAVHQAQELRSAKAIPRLAVDLKNELPEQKGFSEQNIKPMLRFHREYPSLLLSAEPKVPQAAAQLTDLESEAAGSTRVTGRIVAMNEHNVSDVALAVGSVSESVALGPVASAIPLTGRSSMVCLDRMIAVHQAQERSRAKVIARLVDDLKNELPEEKGFSERNIGRMIAFYRAYPILPQAVTKLSAPNIGPEKGGREIKLNELLEDAVGTKELKGVTDRIVQTIGELSQ